MDEQELFAINEALVFLAGDLGLEVTPENESAIDEATRAVAALLDRLRPEDGWPVEDDVEACPLGCPYTGPAEAVAGHRCSDWLGR